MSHGAHWAENEGSLHPRPGQAAKSVKALGTRCLSTILLEPERKASKQPTQGDICYKWRRTMNCVMYHKFICDDRRSIKSSFKILTVTMQSSLTSDSSWSSSQRIEARGAGFAKPVVSSSIWSSLHARKQKQKQRTSSKSNRCSFLQNVSDYTSTSFHRLLSFYKILEI